MSDWTYLMPSVWDLQKAIAPKRGALYSFDLDLPHVGIYCAQESHASKPWLIGMLEINWPYHEQTGEVVWTFAESYMSGDGSRLTLPNKTRTVLLVGNRPHDFKENPVMDEVTMATGRGRYSLECGECGLRVSLRSDSIQKPATALYGAGMREASLTLLSSAVKRGK